MLRGDRYRRVGLTGSARILPTLPPPPRQSPLRQAQRKRAVPDIARRQGVDRDDFGCRNPPFVHAVAPEKPFRAQRDADDAPDGASDLCEPLPGCGFAGGMRQTRLRKDDMGSAMRKGDESIARTDVAVEYRGDATPRRRLENGGSPRRPADVGEHRVAIGNLFER